MMQTSIQYKTAPPQAPKHLKTKGEPSLNALDRESQAHTRLPTQIGFERKFPDPQSRPPHSKCVPISSSRLAALHFFNADSYHEFRAATAHLERKNQTTPLLSVKQPLM